MSSSCILLLAMRAFWQRDARKHTHGHAQVGEQRRRIRPFLLFIYKTVPPELLSIKPQQKYLMNRPWESTSPCLRLQWLAGIWHSINTESWQLERREGRSLIACICLLTVLVLHSSSHSLPAGTAPLRGSPSTDGPRLRCNQQQLAKFPPNK